MKTISASCLLLAYTTCYNVDAFQPPSQSNRRVNFECLLLSWPTATRNFVALQQIRNYGRHRSNEVKTALSSEPQIVDDVEDGKARLLRAVSTGERLDILRAARDLEGLPSNEPDATKVGGRWSLVFSTQTDPVAGMGGVDDDSIFDSINAALYRFFFKFAPFLAGAQERERKKLGKSEGGQTSAKERSGLPGVVVKNEQLVDMQSLGVDNRVSLRLGGPQGPRANIRVIGDLKGDDPLDLGVTFTSFSVEIPPGPKVDIPLPRPVGRLRTTYCDSDLRLSRGGRGGLFVLKKVTDKN